MLTNTEPVLAGNSDEVIANNWNRHVPVKIISQILGVSKLTIYRRAAAMALPPRGTWNDENVQILKEMWLDGNSASQIGLVLGMTRNAVIGKTHRLGLSRDGATSRAVKKFTRKRNAKGAARPKKRHNDGQPLPPLHVPDDADDLKAIGITLLEIKEGVSCRAVIRQVGFGDYRYCGQQIVEGQSYCAGHCARFHSPSTYRGSAVPPPAFRK